MKLSYVTGDLKGICLIKSCAFLPKDFLSLQNSGTLLLHGVKVCFGSPSFLGVPSLFGGFQSCFRWCQFRQGSQNISGGLDYLRRSEIAVGGSQIYIGGLYLLKKVPDLIQGVPDFFRGPKISVSFLESQIALWVLDCFWVSCKVDLKI